MYFQRHVIFTWNPYYISNLIHVDPTTIYKRMFTPRGFYVVYLHGIDVDFTGCFCRVNSDFIFWF